MRPSKSRKAPTPSPAASPNRPAAVNKTEAIRRLIEQWTQLGRECMPKALTVELQRRYPSEQWTLPYVYSIKSKLKKKRPPQAPAVSRPEEVNLGSSQDAAALVLAVKNLAKQAGGLESLKRLIEALQSDG
jgi:hypothetical protein